MDQSVNRGPSLSILVGSVLKKRNLVFFIITCLISSILVAIWTALIFYLRRIESEWERIIFWTGIGLICFVFVVLFIIGIFSLFDRKPVFVEKSWKEFINSGFLGKFLYDFAFVSTTAGAANHTLIRHGDKEYLLKIIRELEVEDNLNQEERIKILPKDENDPGTNLDPNIQKTIILKILIPLLKRYENKICSLNGYAIKLVESLKNPRNYYISEIARMLVNTRLGSYIIAYDGMIEVLKNIISYQFCDIFAEDTDFTFEDLKLILKYQLIFDTIRSYLSS